MRATVNLCAYKGETDKMCLAHILSKSPSYSLEDPPGQMLENGLQKRANE